MAWVVFFVRDLAMAIRVTQLVPGTRLDENGLLYVPDRPRAGRPPVSSPAEAETLDEHWLHYAMEEYGAGEQLRQVLLSAGRLGSDVAGSGNTNSASVDNNVPFLADADADADTDVEIQTEEQGYEFPGYNEEGEIHHPLGEENEATAYGLDMEPYIEGAGEGTSADSTACAICLQEYKAGDELSLVPCPGKHRFHQACLAVWLVRNLSCPLCRHELSN